MVKKIKIGGSLYDDLKQSYINKYGLDAFLVKYSNTPAVLQDEDPIHYMKRTGLAGDEGFTSYGFQKKLQNDRYRDSPDGEELYNRLKELHDQALSSDSVDDRFRTWYVARQFQGQLGNELGFLIAKTAWDIVNKGSDYIGKALGMLAPEAGQAFNAAKSIGDQIYKMLCIPEDLSNPAMAQRVVDAVKQAQSCPVWSSLSQKQQAKYIMQGFDPNKSIGQTNISAYPDPDTIFGGSLSTGFIDGYLPDPSVVANLSPSDQGAVATNLINIAVKVFGNIPDNDPRKIAYKARLQQWIKSGYPLSTSKIVDAWLLPPRLVKIVFTTPSNRTDWSQLAINNARDDLTYREDTEDINDNVINAVNDRIQDYIDAFGVK